MCAVSSLIVSWSSALPRGHPGLAIALYSWRLREREDSKWHWLSTGDSTAHRNGYLGILVSRIPSPPHPLLSAPSIYVHLHNKATVSICSIVNCLFSNWSGLASQAAKADFCFCGFTQLPVCLLVWTIHDNAVSLVQRPWHWAFI